MNRESEGAASIVVADVLYVRCVKSGKPRKMVVLLGSRVNEQIDFGF
jgi:hypothetical protein